MKPHFHFRSPMLKILLALLLATGSSSGPVGALAIPRADAELVESGRRLVLSALASGVRTVVIEDLEDEAGRSTALGRLLADDLARAMVEVDRKLSVCDRDAVESILGEHEFRSHGLVDPDAQAKLGRFCGPDALVYGTILVEDGRLRIQAKLTTMEDARLLGVQEWTVPASRFHLALLEHGPASETDGPVPAEDPREGGAADVTVSSGPRKDDDATKHTDLGLVETSGPFRFELRRCIFERSDYLRCVLSVHNRLPEERSLRLRSAGTFLLDTAGAPYPVQLVTIRGQDYGDTRPGRVFEEAIPPNSLVQMEVIFTDVPRRKKKGQTLSLALDDLEAVYFEDFFLARDLRD